MERFTGTICKKCGAGMALGSLGWVNDNVPNNQAIWIKPGLKEKLTCPKCGHQAEYTSDDLNVYEDDVAD